MKNRVPWLDVCRALAICLVLLSHGRVFLIPIAPWTQTFKFGGFLGVELFFVLSGFLIGSIMISKVEASNSSFGWVPNFWTRRWFRTVPNYVLFVAINFLLLFSIRPNVIPDLLMYLTFTQNLAWQHPGFFPEAWSLAVEEIFYLITPLVVGVFLLIQKKPRLAMLSGALTILVFSIGARGYVVFTTNPTFDDGVRKISLLRLDALMVGVLVAWIYAYLWHWRRVFQRVALFFIPLFVLSIYVVAQPDSFLNQSVFFRIFIFNIASLGCAALIVSGMNAKIPQTLDGMVSRLARWSFSAYLTNLPVLLAIRYFLPAPSSTIMCVLSWALYVSLTFLSAFLIYELYERKFLALRERLS
ncbi:putative acyltransferase [Pseudomonas sp. GM79]|uniref:acyltransferase family protein n=1 Tax=Pseudomonas sp. GM79 TaxID=1144338 RepID=UPI00026F7C15|nr:acyltransferase [Pseudomonas sp. GM79]EJN23469.1 putative acyltransferase [Pseudomonas sp. GM79]